LGEHLSKRNSVSAGLGFRESLTEAEQTVENNWHHKQRHLNLPPDLADHEVRGETAQDQAARPTGMKNVQVGCSVFWEQRSDERINDGFRCSVADGEKKHAPVQTLIGSIFTTGFENWRRCQR